MAGVVKTNDPHPLIRVREAYVNKDRDYLIGALLDPDARAEAAKRIGELGIEEAAEPLMRLLDARDPFARTAAARALGQLSHHAALPKLIDIAESDPDDGVRTWAIGAIGRIPDPQSAALVIPFLREDSWRVRAAAVLALGRLGDPVASAELDAARRRLRRSPVEWILYRRLYNRAIRALRGNGDFRF